MGRNSRLVGNASAFGAWALGGLLLIGCAALWNPVQLDCRMPGGSAFEYELLSFDPRSQLACLQVSYAYG